MLAIDARDNSADNDDLNAISERVNQIETGSTADFDDRVRSALDRDRGSALAGRQHSGGGGDVSERLDVLEGDIEELRDQISELESGNNP